MALIPTTAAQIAEFADALYGIELGNATYTFVNNDVTLLGGLNNTLNAFYTFSYGGNNAAAAAAIVNNVGIIAGKSGLTAADVTTAVNYVQAQLNANPGKEGQIVNSILNSFANMTGDAVYGAAATAWVGNIQVITQYMGVSTNTTDIPLAPGVALSTATVYNLTTGIDNFTGPSTGNAVFNAGPGTLTALDTITGQGSNNVLNVNDTAAVGILSSETVTGVQTANIRSAVAVTGNVSGWTGLTALNVTTSTGADSVTVAGTTAVNITDTAGTVAVAGGSTVTVKTDAASQVSVAGTAGSTTTVSITGGTADTVVDGNSSTTVAAAGVVPAHTAPATATANTITSVSLTGSAGADVVDSDALTTLNVTGTTGATTASVTVNAAAGTRALTLGISGETGGTITDANATSLTVNATGTKSSGVTLSNAAATSMTVNAAVNLSLVAATNAAQAALATVTGTGAGGLTWDVSALGAVALKDVNLSASTGNNTITIDATKTTFEGGSGNNTVTVSASPTVAINGGTGGTNTIVENAGTDILTGNTKISNFQTLGLGTAATGNYDATGFSHLSIAGGTTGNVAFINVAGGVDLTLNASTGNTVTYTLLNSTGANDVLALTLGDGGTYAAGGITNSVITTGVETVNITANGTANTAGTAVTAQTLTLSDAAVKTITISGTTGGFTLTDATDTAITSVNANGLTAGGLTWTSGALANAATITGSAFGSDTINVTSATKAVTITESTGGSDSITLGTVGNDTVTVGGNSNTVTLGGGIDTVTFGSHTATTSAHDTLAFTQGSGLGAANTLATPTSFNPDTTTSQTAILTTNLDVVSGLKSGDVLNLSAVTTAGGVAAAATVANVTNLAGVAGEVVFAHGTYSSSAGTFTYNSSGTDTLMTYDANTASTAANHPFISVVLVGVSTTSALHTALASSAVTLA